MTQLTMANNVHHSPAILVDMAVHRCDTKCSAHCSMPRATPEATGHHHQASTHSVSPQWPQRQQSTNQRYKKKTFACHFDGRGRRFMNFLKTTKHHHRASTCSNITQSDVPNYFGGIFHRQIDNKGLELTFKPQLTA